MKNQDDAREKSENDDKIQSGKTRGKKLQQQTEGGEEQIRGTIKATAYHAYISAAGGYVVCLLVFLIILLNVGSNVFSSWWLAMWIKAGSGVSYKQ